MQTPRSAGTIEVIEGENLHFATTPAAGRQTYQVAHGPTPPTFSIVM